MLCKTSRILAAASILAVLGLTGGSVALADTPVTSPRLQEMEQELRQIQQESQDLGDYSSPSRGAEKAEERIWDLNQNIERLQKLAEEFGESTEYLERLAKEAGEGSIVGAGDVAEEAAEHGAVKGLGRFCTKVVGRAAGWAALVGDVVEYGGKFVILDLNEDKIRDLLESERIGLNEVRELLSALYEEKKAEYRKLRALKKLAERARALRENMLRERQRLAPASRHAVLGRETDAAGDAEELKRYREAGGGVSPSDPNSVQPRRRGVWSAEPADGRQQQSSIPRDPSSARLLAVHNQERAAVGARPLRWDPALEASATAHANQLARTGQLAHASREGRGIERENLNQGMLGWSTDQMMANWLGEKRNFIPGMFPNVSRTGNWYDIGHYSQMIWPETTHVGCGMATGSGSKWLVCRYSPGGNKDGKPVGQPAVVASRSC